VRLEVSVVSGKVAGGEIRRRNDREGLVEEGGRDWVGGIAKVSRIVHNVYQV